MKIKLFLSMFFMVTLSGCIGIAEQWTRNQKTGEMELQERLITQGPMPMDYEVGKSLKKEAFLEMPTSIGVPSK